MKKVAAIHDLSGVGKCSLSAIIPIISSLRLQCCPFPTAILSSQTNFPDYTFLDLTKYMPEYYNVWSKLKISFDCIYIGFLGSINQVDIVIDFIKNHKNSLIIVDPVMGDNLKLYPTFTRKMCEKIKNLVSLSDLTTPNITEACFLTETDLNKVNTLSEDDILNIAKKISKKGPKYVVITGIVKDNKIMNLAYNNETNKHYLTSVAYNNFSYSGTGDIFTAILCGLITNGYNLEFAIKKATDFVFKCVQYTSEFDIDVNEGVMFENFLGDLISI